MLPGTPEPLAPPEIFVPDPGTEYNAATIRPTDHFALFDRMKAKISELCVSSQVVAR
jgi:hypothetical protein